MGHKRKQWKVLKFQELKQKSNTNHTRTLPGSKILPEKRTSTLLARRNIETDF